MRRLLATLLMPLVLLVPSASAPDPVFACTCPERRVPDLPAHALVLVATVGEYLDDERRELYVERWFNGGGGLPRIVVKFGEPDRGPLATCSWPINTSDSIFIAFPGKPLQAEFCSMHARVDSGPGRDWVAAATRRFGPGTPPQSPEEDRAPAAESAGAAVLGVVGLGIAVVVAGLFGSLAFVARRKGLGE